MIRIQYVGNAHVADEIHIDVDSVQAAWRLDAETSGTLKRTVSKLDPAALAAIPTPADPRTLHLYAGTHIEAAPGVCTLANIITDALSVPSVDND